MSEIKNVNVPLADIRVSNDGCGLYDYTITGDKDNNFVIKDNQLFLTKEPRVGTHSIIITVSDPHSRQEPLSVPFSLEVTVCQDCIGKTGATTTLPPCEPRQVFCQFCTDAFFCRDVVVLIDDPNYCDPSVQLPDCATLGFVCDPVSCRPNINQPPVLPPVSTGGCDKLIQIAFIDENNDLTSSSVNVYT